MTKIWRKDSAEARWLQANYKGRWPKDLAAEMTQRFGYIIPPSRVSYYLYHLGLKTGVGARKMTYKHRWVWEQAHGPIPAGHVLVFLDGDKTNCSLDNLTVLPRGIHARMCQRHLYSDDPEKTKSGILVAKLLSKRYARKKYKQGDSQRNWRRKT